MCDYSVFKRHPPTATVKLDQWGDQGRNEDGWRPGQEASLVPHVWRNWGLSEANLLLKKVPVTLLGLFGAPRSDSTPGELRPPYPPHYACGANASMVSLNFYALLDLSSQHSVFWKLCVMNTLLHFQLCQSLTSVMSVVVSGAYTWVARMSLSQARSKGLITDG